MEYKVYEGHRHVNTYGYSYSTNIQSRELCSFKSIKSARKYAIDRLKEDIAKKGWKAYSTGREGGYLICSGSLKYAYVYAWSRLNPNKGHGFRYIMIDSQNGYDIDENGNLGRKW